MGSVQIDKAALRRILEASQEYNQLQHRVAEELMEKAKEIFIAREIKTNEDRLSRYTPPKYIDEFSIVDEGETIKVVNSDPGWYLVEFGGHTDGHQTVPKYRPLGLALDAMTIE